MSYVRLTWDLLSSRFSSLIHTHATHATKHLLALLHGLRGSSTVRNVCVDVRSLWEKLRICAAVTFKTGAFLDKREKKTEGSACSTAYAKPKVSSNVFLFLWEPKFCQSLRRHRRTSWL